MIVALLLFLALVVVASVYFVRIFNGLVGLRENVRKAWANIDVLLTQRHDELPKLVETCKRYMAYERETLERRLAAEWCGSEARWLWIDGGISGNLAVDAASAAISAAMS